MAKVVRFSYNGLRDYISGQGAQEPSPPVNHATLFRHSISMGQYAGCSTSFYGLLSNYSTVMAALKRSHGHYQISPFYVGEETSFKAGISFKLGMVAASIVSEQVYGAPHLFHLNDCCLKVHPQGGAHPDFFAPASQYGSMLVEAKGTILPRVPPRRVSHAVNQLNAVKTITYGSEPPTPPAIRRVICSSFSHKGHETHLEFHDIDPDEEGRVELSFDIDEAITQHYWPWVQILSYSYLDLHQRYTSNGLSYRVCDFTLGIKVGIEEELCGVLFQKNGEPNETVRYDAVKKKLGSTAIRSLLNKRVERTARVHDMSISQGLDGILVEMPSDGDLTMVFGNEIQFEDLKPRR